MELLTVGADVSLTLLPALGTLFFLLGCLVQLQDEGSGLALPYYILSLSCLVVFSCRPALFWWELEMQWIQGRGELGGSGEKWKERKLWSGCIVWDKNLFSIILIYKIILHQEIRWKVGLCQLFHTRIVQTTEFYVYISYSFFFLFPNLSLDFKNPESNLWQTQEFSTHHLLITNMEKNGWVDTLSSKLSSQPYRQGVLLIFFFTVSILLEPPPSSLLRESPHINPKYICEATI